MTIALNNLTYRFSPKSPPAISNITTTLPSGKFIGVVGPDGAGKTTLIRLMAALLKPTEGTITIATHDTLKDAEAVHLCTGYMPQKFGLYEDLTVRQNLNLYADLRGVSKQEKQKTFEQLLHFTALQPFTSRLARTLSGGMKQKLGLACALVKKPQVLLLDEPTVGVDPISRRELWTMVRNLVDEGVTAIWSTSYLGEAENCDEILLLNNGKLLYTGDPQTFIEQHPAKHLEDAFINLLGGNKPITSSLASTMPEAQDRNSAVIVAENLTKRFGNFTAVDNISLSVPKGAIFGLLGPNGAGKTTTFRMLCGLLKPSEGKAFVDGVDLQKAPAIARSHIGYMAQKFSLYGNLSVLQNLKFFAGIYNTEIGDMIDIFNLAPYLSSPADTLPLGYKQRLALACANMHKPRVLFLDEPTSGVDPITRREFWGHISGLVSKGMTIMVTTIALPRSLFRMASDESL